MKKRIQLLNSYVFIFPSLFLTLVLGIYPIAWALRYMFFDYQGYGVPQYIGLDNFTRLLRDQEYWHAVYNTFIYAGGKIVVTLPISLILAVILNKGLDAIYVVPGTALSGSAAAECCFV